MNERPAVSSPTWERLVGLAGGVLVVAIAVLVLVGDETPPAVSVEVTEQRQAAESYVVEVDVRNRGGETVRDVILHGELRRPDGSVVTDAEATVAFLPGGGTEAAALVFTADPGDHEMALRVVGWTDT